MGFCQIFKVELILKALRNFGKSAYLHGKNLAKNEEMPCLNCLWQIFWTEKRISGTGSVIIYLPMYAFTSRLLSLTVSEKYFFAFKKQYWYFYWFFFGSMQEKKFICFRHFWNDSQFLTIVHSSQFQSLYLTKNFIKMLPYAFIYEKE